MRAMLYHISSHNFVTILSSNIDKVVDILHISTPAKQICWGYTGIHLSVHAYVCPSICI